MKIYTYYENIKFDEQDELINLWKKSWRDQGFEPIVLTEKDAQSVSYYETFVDEISKINKKISGVEIHPYTLSCFTRWISYVSLKSDESILVCDYDVINKSFQNKKFNEPSEKLSFLDGFCPCFALGNSEQFLKFCQDIVEKSKSNLDEIKKIFFEDDYRLFHDQTFLSICYNKLKIENNLYNICKSRKYVDFEKIYHVSHNYVQNNKDEDESLEKISSDILRIKLVEKIIS